MTNPELEALIEHCQNPEVKSVEMDRVTAMEVAKELIASRELLADNEAAEMPERCDEDQAEWEMHNAGAMTPNEVIKGISK